MKRLSLISISISILLLTNIIYSQVDFWQQSSDGFDGGAIFALVIDSRNNTIYAGTGGGVLRSKDNGASWTLANSGLTNTDVRALAVNASGHVFAGTEGGGIFRSTDGGEHWEQVNSGLTVRNVWCFAVSQTGQIIAGTGGGHVLSPNGSSVFRSADNGNSWVRVALSSGLTNADIQYLTINAKGDIFAAADGVYRSADGSKQWMRIDAGFRYSYVKGLTVNPHGHIFAALSGPLYRYWTTAQHGHNSVRAWGIFRLIRLLSAPRDRYLPELMKVKFSPQQITEKLGRKSIQLRPMLL